MNRDEFIRHIAAAILAGQRKSGDPPIRRVPPPVRPRHGTPELHSGSQRVSRRGLRR
jgi:hypothetical protein